MPSPSVAESTKRILTIGSAKSSTAHHLCEISSTPAIRDRLGNAAGVNLRGKGMGVKTFSSYLWYSSDAAWNVAVKLLIKLEGPAARLFADMSVVIVMAGKMDRNASY